MNKSRFTEEQIVRILKEVEAGVKVVETCRKHGIGEATCYAWKSKYAALEVSQCGICIDPMDPKAIAEAIGWIAKKPEAAMQMGENGRRTVRERFNWQVDECEFIGLYQSLSQLQRRSFCRD